MMIATGFPAMHPSKAQKEAGDYRDGRCSGKLTCENGVRRRTGKGAASRRAHRFPCGEIRGGHASRYHPVAAGEGRLQHVSRSTMRAEDMVQIAKDLNRRVFEG